MKKPLYAKSVLLSNLPNAGYKTFPHGISGITRVKQLYGYSFNTQTGDVSLPLNGQRPTYTAGTIGAYTDGTNITIETGSDRSNLSAWATIEYIKS